MGTNSSKAMIIAAVFLAILVGAGGAISQTRQKQVKPGAGSSQTLQKQLKPSVGSGKILQLKPSVGSGKILAPKVFNKRSIPRVKSKRQLNISRPLQQSLKLKQSGLSFACDMAACVCTGDIDCNDMFGSGICEGEAAACVEDDGKPVECSCLRF